MRQWQGWFLSVGMLILSGCGMLSTKQAPIPNTPISDLTIGANHTPQSPPIDTVALLLPLSGPQAAAGKAIRDGFLAATYEAKAQGELIPTVQVIDSGTETNMPALYTEAVANGAKFVIGPLTKPGVESLVNKGSFSVPLLALNETNQSLPNEVVQFALSPENDARAVATHALQKGYTRALILAPQSAWGQRMQAAFTESFEIGGGQVLDSVRYNTPKTLASAVRYLLKVNDIQERVVHGKKEKVKPTPRTDADMIFVIGNTAQARQIHPILTFYYANMAVFVPPGVMSLKPNPLADRDLNNVYVVDSPWMFNRAYEWQALKNRLMMDEGFAQNPRLYGLGVDAFLLLRALPSLREDERAYLGGVSGKLSLFRGRIQRHLLLGRYENGVVRFLP